MDIEVTKNFCKVISMKDNEDRVDYLIQTAEKDSVANFLSVLTLIKNTLAKDEKGIRNYASFATGFLAGVCVSIASKNPEVVKHMQGLAKEAAEGMGKHSETHSGVSFSVMGCEVES